MIARKSDRIRDLRMFQVELAAAHKLGRKLQQLLWKDMASLKKTGFGVEFPISYVLFLRAERTFASIRLLSRQRMVDDAFALVRVMVEKIINAEYILLTGTDTALDYMQYHAFREWRDFEELRTVNPKIASKYTTEVLERLRSAHDRARTVTLPNGAIRSRYGRGYDWIEMGLSKRAERIDEYLKERFSVKDFRSTQILYHFTYKKGAVYLHGMWASLARSFELEPGDEGADGDVGKDGNVEINVGIRLKDRNTRVAVDALRTANLVASATILFIGKVFQQKKYVQWVEAFRPLYTEDRRKASSAA